MLYPYPTTRDTGPASLIKSVIHLRHCHPFLEVSFIYGTSMKTQTLLFVTGKLRVVSQPCSSKIRTIQELSQSVSGISIMRNSIVLKGLLAAVTAAVVSNSGNVTLNATATGALGDGAGDSIAYTQITTTATTLTSATALPAPTLANGASANVVITAPPTKVIIQDAKWTYAYANTTTPPAGTYGGVNVNNGRVVYTATMP